MLTSTRVAWTAIAVLAATRGAHADGTCDRLAAEARAEAALLYAPRLEVEGARAPVAATAGDPDAVGGGLQARVAVAVSPIDMLRGRAIERVAGAECVREALAEKIERVLAIGPRAGERAAIALELTYLAARAPDVAALIDEARARLASGRGTALELDELRQRQRTLARRAADLEHQRALLDDEPADDAPVSLTALADGYRRAVAQVDRRRADTRALSAWQLEVRGGAAGGERLDWFVVAEVGYSLGRPWQRAAERRLARARADELTGDVRSPVARLARLRQLLAASARTLAGELVELDAELADLAAQEAQLAGLDGDAARGLRARLTLTRLELEARRAGLEVLERQHRTLSEGAP
ncbi:MAG: hypothetical protein IPH44_25910 [Myxococcales bacterium]|nr:hypothetical protein [Myxococcales bacterium]MBK7195450.1 hypothetical protein [Myxococcales bacterium]